MLHSQWVQANGPYGGYVLSFAVSSASGGENLFAGTNGGGVFLSTNNGTSWTAASTGLTNGSILTFAVSGTNLFAGTYGAGAWKRPLSEMITSVDVASSELPNDFTLAQNYPNPFNPSTVIEFDLPAQSHLDFRVYDGLGRLVRTLVDAEYTAGSHRIMWDGKNDAGSSISSGTYFYQLKTEGFVQAKKMVYLK